MQLSRRSLRAVFPCLLLPLAVVVAACGSSSSSSNKNSNPAAAAAAKEQAKFKAVTAAPSGSKRGGTLTLIGDSDVDYIDPGAAYYQVTYIIDLSAVDTPLMGWPPTDTAAPVPLLASGEPTVTNGGKTITFHIRSGVRYSPPLGGGPGWPKPVVSADVKYAIERGLLPGVPNGYVTLYFSDVVGMTQAEAAVKKDPKVAPNISGITTPDPSTIVFNLDKPTSIGVIDALSLPLSSPVPQGYAAKYDATTPTSTYGQHQLDTGPYYIATYKPATSITLLRNPNFSPSGDFRPAYLDKIQVREGFTDHSSAVRKVLTGSGMATFDFGATGAGLQLAATSYPHQLQLIPSGGDRYIALNNAKPPFNNLDVRKAVIANADRYALLNTRGGLLSGAIETHIIPPGIPGFQQAGGYAGPSGSQFDWNQHPHGDLALAESYMKKAGYTSGKCSESQGPGHCTLTMVSDDSPPGSDTAQVFKSQLAALGFTVQLHPVAHDVMYTKFCSVVAAEPNVCPNVGWVKDFNDGQAMIDVPFNGQTIAGSPSNNSNWAQFNNPTINAALNAAKLITDPTQRAAQYGKIDDMIMAQAPVVPWDWDYDAEPYSSNVAFVSNLFNSEVDLSFTSLK